MNIQEAYAFASKGHRITHKYFSSEEYLENRFGVLTAEDGVPFEEEFVRRVDAGGPYASGWSIYRGEAVRDLGKKLVETLESIRFRKHDSVTIAIEVDVGRPELEVIYDRGTRTVIEPLDCFQLLFTRMGLTITEAMNAEALLIHWLRISGFGLTESPSVFHRKEDNNYLSFSCKWQPLRPLEQLIKYYE